MSENVSSNNPSFVPVFPDTALQAMYVPTEKNRKAMEETAGISAKITFGRTWYFRALRRENC
jgi:hypothetical protein